MAQESIAFDAGSGDIEQALKNSETRFRLVVEASPGAMVMTRRSGQIEMLNAQAERMFGYPREEIVGRQVEMLLPERFRGRALQYLLFGDPGSRPTGAGPELFGLRKDDSEFPVEIGLNPIETDDGPMILYAIVDISERMRTAERFRLVVEASPSAMVMVRATGQIEMVNAQAERMFGYPREELLGQQVEMLLPERLCDRHPALCEGLSGSPRSRSVGAEAEWMGRRNDGVVFPVEIGLNPIETDDGPMILYAIVDMSERARAAQALAQSEAELRASFEGAAVGKVLADPVSRRITRANLAFARMLGYRPEELVGRTCPQFTWHEDLAADAADYARLLSGEDDVNVREMRYMRRDGSPFWVRASATITRASGIRNRAIVVGAIEDIDTRYKAEVALRVAKQELEQVVEERTRALSERDLLLREVYHRVKNNLQLVDSLLVMQGRKLEDPRAREALLSLRGRIFALGLVHQQLMGSADLKTFDVVPFLDDLSKNILEGVGTAGVNISVEACTLVVGLDFAVPLGLLVTELVTNSLKHAFPFGTGNISVILRNDIGGKLVLTVADDGIGPPDDNTAGKPEFGLGTRIINNLVGQLEGTMVVRRANGMTTEIRIDMPVQS
ncbi:MAG: signal transduction histidine kinase [Rhodopila sp.]|nr:signal transduction histidine kinase [Rhodopila sp.]